MTPRGRKGPRFVFFQASQSPKPLKPLNDCLNCHLATQHQIFHIFHEDACMALPKQFVLFLQIRALFKPPPFLTDSQQGQNRMLTTLCEHTTPTPSHLPSYHKRSGKKEPNKDKQCCDFYQHFKGLRRSSFTAHFLPTYLVLPEPMQLRREYTLKSMPTVPRLVTNDSVGWKIRHALNDQMGRWWENGSSLQGMGQQ